MARLTVSIPRFRVDVKNAAERLEGFSAPYCGGFLGDGDLTELARDGLAEHRLARRANALVLGIVVSCDEVGRVLLIDDATIRTWHDLLRRRRRWVGRVQLRRPSQSVEPGTAGRLKAWLALAPDDREVGAWIERESGSSTRAAPGWSRCCIVWDWNTASPKRCRANSTRPTAGLHRRLEGLLKTLPNDEAVMFADAVHPTHGPVGCWAPKEIKVAVDQAGSA